MKHAKLNLIRYQGIVYAEINELIIQLLKSGEQADKDSAEVLQNIKEAADKQIIK